MSRSSRKVMLLGVLGALRQASRATDHDSDQFTGPFLAAFSLLAAAHGSPTNIYLDFCHFTRADVSEKQLTPASWWNHKQVNLNYFANTIFFLVIVIQADSWQVVHPQLQSINLSPHLLSPSSRPAMLIKQRWLSGRISSAWWSPAARPECGKKKELGCQIVSLVKCYSSNKYEYYV